MVVLLDLDDDPHPFPAGDLSASPYEHFKNQLRGPLLRAGNTHDVHTNGGPVSHPDKSSVAGIGSEVDEEERPNPNLNGFSAALSCYP